MAMNKQQELLKMFLRDVSQKNKLNEALENYVKHVTITDDVKKLNEIPFSSERKYSACIYHDFSLVLGAPEMLLEKTSQAFTDCQLYTQESFRVVVFGKIAGQFSEKQGDIKKKFHPLAIIALDDPIRNETPSTLDQLLKEDIQYRIISGDSPDTVVAIAKRINKNYPATVISGEELDVLEGDAQEKAILGHAIFARIKPHQKQLIVRTLKKNKLFTIMIGDGVNDVLALKESDLGIAMNGGSSMAKDVADVVLVNNSFASLPILLYEGRRIITNIQTIANIYLIKNISSIIAVLMLGFIGLRFPFDPRHVQLSSFLVIGIPSFVLALEKHSFVTTDEGFLKRLLLFSGIVGFGDAILYTMIYTYYELTSPILFYSRSMILTSVIFLGLNNIILIYLQHYSPKEIIRRKIIVSLLFSILVIFLFSIQSQFIRDFFALKKMLFIDLMLVFLFSLFGSMIIFLVLKEFNLIKKDINPEYVEEKIVNATSEK